MARGLNRQWTMRTTPLVHLVPLVLLVGSGCGGRASGGESAPSPSEPTAASAPPATVLGRPTRFGSVDFYAFQANVIAAAYFDAEPPTAAADGCVTFPLRAPRDVVLSQTAGAMTVTFTPTSGRELTVPLAWKPEEGRYAWQDSSRELARMDRPAAPVTFQASGDVVPAFRVTIPSADDLEVTRPKPYADGLDLLMTVAAGADLELAWAPSQNDIVEVWLDGRTSLSCRFPAAATRGTVPAAMLAEVLVEPEPVSACPKGQRCLRGGIRALRETRVRTADTEILARTHRWFGLELAVEP